MFECGGGAGWLGVRVMADCCGGNASVLFTYTILVVMIASELRFK